MRIDGTNRSERVKQKASDPETDDIHPEIVNVTFSGIQDVLSGLDRSRKKNRDQYQPSLSDVRKKDRNKKSERRKNEKVAEELDENSVTELTGKDLRPIYREGSLKREQIDASFIVHTDASA